MKLRSKKLLALISTAVFSLTGIFGNMVGAETVSASTDTLADEFTEVQAADNLQNRLSLGTYHSAYIDDNGDLYTWGNNSSGQLGDGTTANSTTPVKIMSNVSAVSLGTSLGKNYSACITSDGDLYAWGYNEYGQLGNGTTENRYTPVKIMSNVKAVSLGGWHSACITTDGDLYTWGANGDGRLGDGTTESRTTPVKIMSNVKAVSLGYYHSACITENGDLYTWGNNSLGELGDGTETNRNTPVKIMENVSAVSLGGAHSACITADGDLYTWGHCKYGQLGDGITQYYKNGWTYYYRITPVKIMENVSAVALGDSHSACITLNGDLYTWGSNYSGRLGDGTKGGHRSRPVKIMENVSAVDLGWSHSACITTNGELYTWGYNEYGELGNGTTEDSSTPVKIMVSSIQKYIDLVNNIPHPENGSIILTPAQLNAIKKVIAYDRSKAA